MSEITEQTVASATNNCLKRYRHPSHCHKLFQNIVRSISIYCDNENCRRRICNNEISYVCFRCDFDLCIHCFSLPTEPECVVELDSSDSFVNEQIDFYAERMQPRAKTVMVKTYVRGLQPLRVPDSDGSTSLSETTNNIMNHPEPQTQHQLAATTTEQQQQPATRRIASIVLHNSDYDAQTNQSINNLLGDISSNLTITIPTPTTHPRSDSHM
jgi:hypothetical protein